jgi:hypothetical protein
MNITDNMTAHEMLALAEHRTGASYPFQQIDLGNTDRRGNPVYTNGVGVNARAGELSWRYWFADECGHEAYDVSREEALQIIIEVQMHRHAR